MKILRYMVVIIGSLFIMMCGVSAASTNFEPTINMQPDITENQLQILLGYKGEEVMAINHTFSWDSRYVTLLDVIPLENFTITKGNEVEDGYYRTINILADSDYSFLDTNYALLIFEVTDKFKVGSKSDIIYYNYEAVGPVKDKFRHKGSVMTLQRDTNSEMLFLLGDIDNNFKMKYWFKQNYLIFIFVGLIIIAILVVIFNLPSKRKTEHREKEIRNQTKEPTYIPKKEVSPYKIDNEVLDNIGGAKPQVDMSEAIIISDVNPFTPQQSQPINNVSEVSQQQSFIQEDLTQIKAIPQSDNYNTVIDAFSQTIIPDASTEINENITTEQNIETLDVVEVPQVRQQSDVLQVPVPEVTNNSSSDLPVQNNEMIAPIMDENNLIQEVNDNPENLVLFQPTNFEEKVEEVIDTLSFILVFFLASFLFIPFVKAADVDPNMIRECIVGNIPFNKEYDLNGDYKVDVVDILLTKDLSNVKLDSEDDQAPGFADIDGVSDTIISTGKDKTTTTTTTTKKVWIPIPTKKTTTKNQRTTTNKKTTVRKTTAKKTTTKRTTTKKSTTATTTTTTPIYNVRVVYDNAKVNVESQQVKKGNKAYFEFTPDIGYKYSGVTCSGASSSWSSSYNKLTVSYITKDAECTVKFVKRTDMKVIINASNALNSRYTIKGKYLESESLVIKPKTGHQYKSLSCSNVKATYSNNKFTVESLTNDDTCTLEFAPIPYDLTINYGNNTKKITDIPYGTTTTFSFDSTESKYKKAKCVYSGTSKIVYLTETQKDSLYNYEFEFKVTNDTTCTVS